MSVYIFIYVVNKYVLRTHLLMAKCVPTANAAYVTNCDVLPPGDGNPTEVRAINR